MEMVSIDALGTSTEGLPIKQEAQPAMQEGAAFDEAVGRFRAAMGEGLAGVDLGGLGLDEGVSAPVGDGSCAKVPVAEASDADDFDLDVPDGGAVAADPSVVVNPMAYNPVADVPVVQQVVGDTMKVAAVDSAESVRSVFLAAAVEEVCEAIQVAPGVQPGQGEVRIQLKADVLSGTEVFLEAKGTTITVAFNPATADVAEVLARNITQFQQHLAGRIHNYQIAARVNKELKG
mgnify:CR=1 FL=1